MHELGAVVKIVNLQYVLGGKAIDDQIAYFKQCGNLGDLKSYYFDNAEDYENYVIRYKKREKGIESETDKINVSDYPEEEIKDIVIDIRNGRAKNFIIRKRLSSFIINDMKQRGVFIYTEIEPLYFYNKTKKLLRFTNDNRLAALINDLYGLNASEKEYDYLIKEMESEVINRGNRILIRQFSHYDKNKNKLYISKFNGQMYVLDGKEVSLEDNGYDGVLFFDRPEWEPYEYRGDLTSDKEIEAKIIDPINFNTSQQKGLTPKEQGLLLLIHIYSLFFGSIQPTRPICAFIGPKGSGKSSADMRRLLWLFGSNIQVLRIPDKKDGFIATVTNRHHFVVFDNVDSSLKWLNDFLAMIATGGKFAMRILYTTNQEEQHSVDIFLSLNARTPKFRRDDVADRLLLFYLERLAKFIPEIKLRQDISQSRDLLWSDIINRLNRLLHFLSTSTDELKDNPYRMADFADLGWRIAKSINREEEFLRILNKMQAKQSEFSAEQDPLFYLIDIWLEDKPGQCSGALLVKDLFSELKEVAEKHKLPFYYKSPMSLALTISNILLDLKTHFDIKEKDMPSNERFYTFSKKNNYGIPLQEEDLTADIHEPDRGYSNDEQ